MLHIIRSALSRVSGRGIASYHYSSDDTMTSATTHSCLRRIVKPTIVLICPFAAFILASKSLAQSPQPVVTSPDVPSDVSIPAGFPDNPIAFFDDYSWRAFIALVWPAQAGMRGTADRTQSVDGKWPRVFETFKSVDEVFHFDGSAPGNWNDYDDPKYNPCGLKAGFSDLTLGSFSKFGDLGLAGIGKLIGPLVAQPAADPTYVRYLTGFNQVEFQKIAGQKWYLQANLPAPPPAPPSSITFDNGSITVKSAWVDMRSVANPDRFYTRQATVLDPVTGVGSSITVGLVGIHIVQKTPSRPQWIWSSFEQIDNVPGTSQTFGTFTFNDGTATAMPASPPYNMSRVLTPPTAAPFSVERVKTNPIHDSTKHTNDLYHNALDPRSIWRFYQLVVTQWPLVPNSPKTPGTPPNTFPGVGATTAFANVTMETFDQDRITLSCMACHNVTMQRTDFVWSLSDHAFPPVFSSPSTIMKDPALRQLRNLLLQGVPCDSRSK